MLAVIPLKEGVNLVLPIPKPIPHFKLPIAGPEFLTELMEGRMPTLPQEKHFVIMGQFEEVVFYEEEAKV